MLNALSDVQRTHIYSSTRFLETIFNFIWILKIFVCFRTRIENSLPRPSPDTRLGLATPNSNRSILSNSSQDFHKIPSWYWLL